MMRSVGIRTLVAVPHSEQNHIPSIDEMKKLGIEIELYKDFESLKSIANSYGISHSLFVHDGRYNNLWIPNTKHLVYAVFNHFEPHGHVYAYVSQWLFKHALRKKVGRSPNSILTEQSETDSPFSIDKTTKVTWVPHTVIPLEGDGKYFKSYFGIPDGFFLIGRIGGYTEFNDPLIHEGLMRLVESDDSIYVVLINTRPFYLHPRIKYIGFISENLKWDFYAACDLFLNGRLMGESFGFSIVEPLMLGKPIIAPSPIRNRKMDRHHAQILHKSKLLYTSVNHFIRTIQQIKKCGYEENVLKELVKDFTFDSVRNRFIHEFIE